MCLYPQLIKNKKYTKTKKNGGNIPAVPDERVKYVPVGCGRCMECMKQKARGWQIRLLEEIKQNKNGKFITLTFSNESICKIIKEQEITSEGYELDNEIATKAMRLFLERWRKKYKKSLRHWLVTELGHNGTENVHLHGIVWTEEKYEQIETIWQYGFIWPTKEHYKNTYVGERTINYIIKYVTKQDEKHKEYKPKILCSPGIGNNYTNTSQARRNKYNPEGTRETYKTGTGHEINLPVYYRNKLYTEQERERLWLEKLDKNERWICGEKIKADNLKEYNELLKWYREINKKLGYGSDEKNWNREQYELNQRKIMYEKRKNNIQRNNSNATNNTMGNMCNTDNSDNNTRIQGYTINELKKIAKQNKNKTIIELPDKPTHKGDP